MTTDLHLANGHLLTIQPQPHRGKFAGSSSDAIDNCVAELATRSENINSGDGMAETPSSRPKPTRLPVLKVFADKDHSQKDTGTSPKQKEQSDAAGSQTKKSPSAMELDLPKSTDQERERYWRRVREKLDGDSPTVQKREKPVYHHGAYRKIISLASSPRQEISKHKWKYSGVSPNGKLSTLEASLAAKTNHLSPDCRDNIEEHPSNEHARSSNGTGRTNSNHSTNSSGSESSGQKYKTHNTPDSSYNSNSSVSPISGPSTSMKEWEDRFVVHMPSAREPNPPTMNVQQIAEYQRSIENVHEEGETMLDPDTLPSPRTTTPEEPPKSPNQGRQRLGTLDGQESKPAPSNKETEGGMTHIPPHRRYYSPDEIGKQRFSTIWEESSTPPKQKSHQANPDGSFLGCKEINGPNDRNPDEILFFSTPERPKVVSIPSHTSRLPRESKLAAMRHVKRASGETKLVQEEWEPISQNLKHAQCSKPSPKPLCQDTHCQHLATKKSASPQQRVNPDSTGEPSENRKSGPRADDVFIITPTITRTMVTTADFGGHVRIQPCIREPTSRSAGEVITDARTNLLMNTKAGVLPSGLRRVTQNSWGSSGVPSAIPSKPAFATNIPVSHPAGSKTTDLEKPTTEEKPRGMRGFIRTPCIVRSSTEARIDRLAESPQEPTPASPASMTGSISATRDSSNSPHIGSSSPSIRTASIHSTTRDSPQLCGTRMEAKIVDVAELDGHQVNDQRGDSFNSKTTRSSTDRLDSEMQSDLRQILNSETFNAVIDMLLLFVAQVQGFHHQIKANRGSRVALLKLFLNGILSMLEHCLHVFRKVLAGILTYNTTGIWPDNNNDKELDWSVTEIGQALVYLVVLGFVAMIIGRAAGYVILIGTWIVWLARPFTLVFRTIARVFFL